jgi:hypothetical protein
MGVFDDDDEDDVVADWDAFDAVVAQHQQKKQVRRGAVLRKLNAFIPAGCMQMCMLIADGCFLYGLICNAHCHLML